MWRAEFGIRMSSLLTQITVCFLATIFLMGHQSKVCQTVCLAMTVHLALK
jgi:hypothetical protein